MFSFLLFFLHFSFIKFIDNEKFLQDILKDCTYNKFVG